MASDNNKNTLGVTIWFTGLPSSGKSTVSRLVHDYLKAQGLKVELLDGDVARQNLTKGLGFSKEDRDENIRRIGFVCNLLSRNGVIAIAAAISPYRAARDAVRQQTNSFIEIYVNAPLDVCKQRDVKGLYKKALAGQLPQFTGVSDPYEEPLNPELVLYTNEETPEESARKVIAYLIQNGNVPATASAILISGRSA